MRVLSVPGLYGVCQASGAGYSREYLFSPAVIHSAAIRHNVSAPCGVPSGPVAATVLGNLPARWPQVNLTGGSEPPAGEDKQRRDSGVPGRPFVQWLEAGANSFIPIAPLPIPRPTDTSHTAVR